MHAEKIVAIGASAGGLAALEAFFRQVPSNLGCAYVVVQHLSSDFKSVMDDILARYTKMPVKRAAEGMALEEDAVYLIPPGKMLTLKDRSFHLEDKELSLKFPIDVFFQSMAEASFTVKVGILLSGSGQDGTQGIEAIRKHDGVVIVQSPETAEFEAMLTSAIQTGLVDEEMDPADMGDYLSDLFTLDSEGEHGGKLYNFPTGFSLKPYFDLLSEKSSIQFDRYKETTLRRRIARRIQLNSMESPASYLEYLAEHEEELDHLLQDILIGVTDFFRDESAFEALEKELETKLSSHEGEFRCWVAGCASGQEVYSIAMLLREIADRIQFSEKIFIFATDVYQPAIDQASRGEYTQAEVQSLSGQRRDAHFAVTAKGHFKVSKELRRMVVFAPHNLIQDPPFTNMDLTSCRNFLIYLKPPAQEDALYNLRYSLRAEGLLFLGKSESLGNYSESFKTLRARQKIFQVAGNQTGDLPLSVTSRSQPRTGFKSIPRPLVNPVSRPPPNLLKGYDALLEKYCPDGLIMTGGQEIVHFLGSVSKYLLPLKGRSSSLFSERAPTELTLAVSTLFRKHQVQPDEETLFSHGISVDTSGSDEVLTVNLALSLLNQGTDEQSSLYFLAIKEPVEKGESDPPATGSTPSPEGISFDIHQSARDRISDLELELQSTRQNLNASIEELEIGNEEIQAANEEITAANEEMQSTNEELSSVNEELHSRNEELESKNHELEILNADHRNLLNSLSMGIIFVDRELQIRKFNPAILDFFELRESDIGRPLKSLSYKLENQEELLDAITRVIREGRSEESEALTQGGRWFQKRILPYYNAEDAIEGALICFAEISELKQMELQLERALKVSRMVYWHWELPSDELTVQANEDCMLGYECGAVSKSGRFWMDQIHSDDRKGVEKLLEPLLEGETDTWRGEHRFRTLDGSWKWVYQQGEVLEKDSLGKPLRISGITQDIHQRKLDELALRKNEQELETLIEQPLLGIGLLNPEGEFIRLNESLIKLTGFDKPALLGTHFGQITHPEFKEYEGQLVQQILNGEQDFVQYEKRIYSRGGKELWVLAGLSAACNEDGEVIDLIHQVVDISEIKAFQQEIESLTERYEIAAEAAQFGLFQWEVDSERILYDEQLLKMSGLPGSDAPRYITYDEWFESIHPMDRDHMEKAVNQCLEAGTELNERYRIVRGDGQSQTLQAFGVFTKFEEGLAKQMIGINQNVTQLDEAEEKTRELQSQLFQSQKMEMIGNLAGGIAHDFNNILAALMGYVEIIGRRESLSPNGKEYLQHMQQSLERAKNLVAQILTFSRKGEVRREKLDIFLYVREALDFLESSIPSSIQFQETLSKQAGQVLGDPVHMHQVVVNLCTNAQQAIATNDGAGGKIEVSLEKVTLEEEVSAYGRILKPGSYSCLKVSDNGVGISQENQSRIFEPFFTTKETGKGTGLGLSVVRGIMDDLDGGILVKSELGKGTEIAAYFPLLDTPAEPSSTTRQEKEKWQDFDGGGRRVLFVDDERAIMVLGQRLLEDANFQVNAFTRIEEAEASLFENGRKYDLIITDQIMSSVTGIQFAQEIRRRGMDLPILLISGFGMDITAEALAGIGNIRFVEKPYTSQQLFQELSALLN